MDGVSYSSAGDAVGNKIIFLKKKVHATRATCRKIKTDSTGKRVIWARNSIDHFAESVSQETEANNATI